MKLQRTQVYLAGEIHRRLGRDAAERGMSLAAYVREVVEAHYARRGAAPSSSFDDLIGCVDDAPAGDVATDGPDYRDRALRERLARKLGRPRAPGGVRKQRRS
jgi:hypothetical protein